MTLFRQLLVATGVVSVGFLAVTASAQSNTPPIPLAIVSDDPSAGTAADLLTAELSRIPALQLMERNDIARIRREHALSAANGDFVRLGQILGTDGLLLLDPVQDGTNHFLTARLVAVNPGVVLASSRTPWPVPDTPKWTQLTVTRFAPLFPKLGVLAQDAIPLSVINLRSAARNAQSEDLETRINALAVERLTQQPELFVLERRRMDLLSDEKDLNDSRQSAFWSGSYLLDGVIDRDGYDPDTVTIDARLTPPHGDTPIVIGIKAARANLTGAVNQLAAQMTQRLKLHAAAPSWNPADEADQYFEEAQWALRWNMFDEARSAIESTWSLGKQTQEVARLRIGVYYSEAESHWPTWLSTSDWSTAWSPDPAKLQPAIKALELYQSAFATFLSLQTNADIDWYELGLEVLNRDSMLLNQFAYYGRQDRVEHQDDFLEMRALARDLARQLDQHPAYKVIRVYPPGAYSPPMDSHNPGLRIADSPGKYLNFVQFSVGDSSIFGSANDLALAKATGGAFWWEKPEDCVKMYHELFDSGDLDRTRQFIAYLKVPAADPKDRIHAARLWRDFVQELCDSTNGFARIDGYYFKFMESQSDADYRDAANRLFDTATENAYQLVASHSLDVLVADIGSGIRNAPYGLPSPPIQAAVSERFSHDLKPEVYSSAALHLMSNDVTFESGSYDRFLFPLYDEDVLRSQPRARQLLSAIDRYRVGFLQRNSAQSDYYNRNFDELENWLRRALPPEPPVANTATNASPRPVRPPPPVLVLSPSGPGVAIDEVPRTVAATSSNVIHVTRFWRVPPESTPEFAPMAATLQFRGAKYRGNRLWVEVVLSDYVYFHSACIYGLNLSNFQTISVPVPREAYDTNSLRLGKFEVVGDSVFVSATNRLLRYSLEKQSWEALTVPVNGLTGLYSVNDRLFLIDKTSIQALHKDAAGFDLIASTRRRPAENSLDELPDFGPGGSFANGSDYDPAVIPGPDGQTRIFAKGKLYSLLPGSNNWGISASLPVTQSQWRADGFENGMLINFYGSESETRWYLLNSARRTIDFALMNPEVLGSNHFSQGISPHGNFSLKPSPSMPDHPGQPLWQCPPDLTTSLGPAAYDGSNLWFASDDLAVVAAGNAGPIFSPYQGRHILLVEFEHDRAEPRCLPVWFDTPPGTLSPEWRYTFRHYNITEPIDLHPSVFAPTDQGIVVGYDQMHGLWFIPKADLEPRPAATGPDACLIAAAENGDLAAATNALARSANIETRNYRGWTSLIIAASSTNFELAKLLIDHGADVNAKSSTGNGITVLTFAAGKDELDLIRELLRRGASVNARGSDGFPPLLQAVGMRHKDAAELLVLAGADLEILGPTNEAGYQFRPLIAAAYTGDTDLAEMLLSKGARLENVNNRGETAVMVASKGDHTEAVKLLIAKGANVNATAPRGQTALIYAAYNGRTETVQALLAAGANPHATATDIRDDGSVSAPYSAVDVAREQNHPEAMALILQALQQAATRTPPPRAR